MRTSVAAHRASTPPSPSRQPGVDVVIAKSFARIFYRNAINTGLAIMECPEAVDAISNGDVVSVDADAGIIVDETTGQTFHGPAVPPVHQGDHRTPAASMPPHAQKKLGKDA